MKSSWTNQSISACGKAALTLASAGMDRQTSPKALGLTKRMRLIRRLMRMMKV
jgi:hypothetical protein